MDRFDDALAEPFPPGWDSFVSARDRFLATLAADSATPPHGPSTDDWLVGEPTDDENLLTLDW